MGRREFITLLGGAAAAWPLAAYSAASGADLSPRRLCPPVHAMRQPIVAMFDELRRFGFIEGQNLTIDWRSHMDCTLI